MRMPTRLTSVTFPAPRADTCAQITPYCSPDGALPGTVIVATRVASLCGTRFSVLLLIETQVVISFWVSPLANRKVPPEIVAAAG
jgi:hypothetical protein